VKRLLLLCLLLTAGCSDNRPPGPAGEGEETLSPRGTYRQFTPEEWKQLVLEAPGPVLVEFGATWCGPCRKMEPVLENLARDFAVYKVDGDANPGLKQAAGIDGYPSLLVFYKGRVTARYAGYTPEAPLRESLQMAGGGR
jgi:thioredoxin 1